MAEKNTYLSYQNFLSLFGWGLLVFLIIQYDLKTLVYRSLQVNGLQIFAGITLLIIAQGIRSLKWSVLFGEYMSRAMASKLYFSMISYAIFSPLRMADLTIAPILRKQWNINYKRSFTLLFFEKVGDMLVLCIFTVPATILFINTIVEPRVTYEILLATGAVFLGACIIFLTFFNKKVCSTIQMSFLSKKKISFLIFFSFLALTTELLAGYILVHAFYRIDILNYFLLKPISIIIGVFSFVPGGMGVESYSLIELFSLIGLDDKLLAIGIINVRLISIISIIFFSTAMSAIFSVKKNIVSFDNIKNKK